MTHATTAIKLPPPADLERICKGIATLDAILCAEWEYRYYSFNAAWSETSNDRMASMRNGEGDDWFIVFTAAGTFVKCYWHEYKRENVASIYESLPLSLAAQLREPAFGMEAVTFGGFHDGSDWTLRGNAEALAGELAILSGDPAAYRAFAADYFEVQVPLDAIAHVLAEQPLSAGLVARIASERRLEDLASDLAEIGYGRSS